MALNPLFRQNQEGQKLEADLHQSLVTESIQIKGIEVYYIKRDSQNKDSILNEDPLGSFSSATGIEMFLESFDGFNGQEQDLVAGWGIQLTDRATFSVSTERFMEVIEFDKPKEGDLIYMPLSNTLLEIQHAEDEEPFYTLGNVPFFKIQTEIFDYSGEEFNTGVSDIDVLDDDVITNNDELIEDAGANDEFDTEDDDIVLFTTEHPYGVFGRKE